MSRSPRWSPYGAGRRRDDRLVAAACSSATARHRARPRARPRAPAQRPRRQPPPSSQAAYTAEWPTRRPARLPCGEAAAPDADTCRIHRRVQADHGDRRAHRRVRPVQPGRRVPRRRSRSRAFAINDSDYLAKHAAGQVDPRHARTAPARTSSRNGSKGNQIVFEANPNYWGTKALDAEPRVPLERRGRPAPGSSSRPARSTASTTPAPTTSDRSRPTRALKFYPREGLNIMYIGINNTVKPFDNEKVRQAIAMGIDRKRIVDNFYPTGSEVADSLHAVRHPARLRRRPVRGTSTRPRPSSCSPSRLPETASTRSTPSSRSATASAATSRIRRRSRPDIQAQLKDNLNINATIDVQESGTFLDNAAAGKLDGIYPPRLGRRLPRHHQLPRLPLRLGLRQEVRQAVPRTSSRRSTRAPSRPTTPPARPRTPRPTT